MNVAPRRRRPRRGQRLGSRDLIAAGACSILVLVLGLVYVDSPGSASHASHSTKGPSAAVNTRRAPPIRASKPRLTEPPRKTGNVAHPAAAPGSVGPARTSTVSATATIVPALEGNAEASFANLTTRLGLQGRLGVAIQPLGRGKTEVLGGDPAMQAMSTSKILILSALLRDKGGVDNLTAEQRSLAEAAVTESDNDAVLALFADLEADKGGLLGASAYATSLLRQVGDDQTQVTTAPPPPGYATTFGQTPWTPTAEVTFFRSLALGCVLPPPDTSYVLGLMRSIEPSESFGLGSAGFPQVAFKGGWGPEPGEQYGVRQTGIVGGGSSGVVVAITADPVSTFAAGQSVLDQVADWLQKEIRIAPRPPASCPARAIPSNP